MCKNKKTVVIIKYLNLKYKKCSLLQGANLFHSNPANQFNLTKNQYSYLFIIFNYPNIIINNLINKKLIKIFKN